MKKTTLIFSIFIFALLMPMFAHADKECDFNNYINPMYALCSTHAYNAGWSHNKPNMSVVNDVVALKSTIITQQMYQNYAILEMTIKRLKTQLEKAILTAKMEAAGMTSKEEQSSVSGKSKDSAIFIAGAQNCLTQSGAIKETLKCIQRNISLMRNESNMPNIRKQLVNELDAYQLYDKTGYDTLIESACKNAGQINKNELAKCLNSFNATIGIKLDKHDKSIKNNKNQDE